MLNFLWESENKPVKEHLCKYTRNRNPPRQEEKSPPGSLCSGSHQALTKTPGASKKINYWELKTTRNCCQEAFLFGQRWSQCASNLSTRGSSLLAGGDGQTGSSSFNSTGRLKDSQLPHLFSPANQQWKSARKHRQYLSPSVQT